MKREVKASESVLMKMGKEKGKLNTGEGWRWERRELVTVRWIIVMLQVNRTRGREAEAGRGRE